MTFELSTLALEEQTSLHLLHPAHKTPLFADAEETKAVTLNLKGKASATYRRVTDAMLKKHRARKSDPSPEEQRKESVEFLTALSISIDNLTLDGETVDNPDAFRKLYNDARFDWIKEQINECLDGYQNFLK